MFDKVRAARFGLLAAGAMSVAACGGGGTSAGSGVSYDQMVSGLQALENELADTPTPVGDMPVAGTASYAGFGELFGDGSVAAVPASMAGEVDLTADFGSGTVGGRMSALRTSGNDPVSGVLEITSGTITDNEIDVVMEGDLSAGGATAAVDLVGLGTFYGPDADYIDAAVNGTATSGATSGNVFGFFVVRRQ